MKKIKHGLRLLSILIAFVLLGTIMVLATNTELLPPGTNITEKVDVTIALLEQVKHNGKGTTTIIKDGVLITDNAEFEDNEIVNIVFSWEISDSVKQVKGGDYFRIEIPTILASIVATNAQGYAPIYDKVDTTKVMGYWKLVRETEGNEKRSFIQFVADDNFESISWERNGYFALSLYVEWTNRSTENLELFIDDIRISAKVSDPYYTPKRYEQSGYPGARMYSPQSMVTVYKRANGKVRPVSDGRGTAITEWNVNFGLDDYAATTQLRDGDTYKTHENIVIRDEITQEGQVFKMIGIRLPIFSPYDETGVTTPYLRGFRTARVSTFGFKHISGNSYATNEEWEAAVSDPANAPAYGISRDGKIAIMNIGNTFENGIKYASDNEQLEQVLRSFKTLTNDEVKTLMMSLGENTPEYTLTRYDGTQETIAIDSYINNRAVAYTVEFYTEVEMKPGREYSNEVMVSYDGITEEHQGNGMFRIDNNDAAISGIPSGIVYIYKHDEKNYNTSEEEELVGARFALYKVNEDGEVHIETKVTDGLGSLFFENLSAGKYKIYEESSGNEHSVDTLKLFKRQENGEHVLYSSDALGDNWFEFEVTKEERNFYFDATNKITKTGAVSLTKLGADDPTKKLQGAVFELQNEEGTYVSKYDEHNEVYIFSDLPLGIYTISETEAPEGYDKEFLDGIFDIDPGMPGIQIRVSSSEPLNLVAYNIPDETNIVDVDSDEKTNDLPIFPPLPDDNPYVPEEDKVEDVKVAVNTAIRTDLYPNTGDSIPVTMYVVTMITMLCGILIIAGNSVKRKS